MLFRSTLTSGMVTTINGIGDIEALCEGVGLPNTAGLSYPGWMYLVNGVQPDVGFAQYTLNDGDQVMVEYMSAPELASRLTTLKANSYSPASYNAKQASYAFNQPA